MTQKQTKFQGLTSSGSSRNFILYNRQGNAGCPIHIFKRTEVSDHWIIISRWQVVKTIKNTWLTAIARYAPTLKWPDKKLYQVYYSYWVDRCKPDSQTKDVFWDEFVRYEPPVQEGGRWDDRQPFDTPRKFGPRDFNIGIGEYWWFKIDEHIMIKPEFEDEIRDVVIKERVKNRGAVYERYKRLLMHSLHKEKYLQSLKERLRDAKKRLEKDVSTVKELAEKSRRVERIVENLKKIYSESSIRVILEEHDERLDYLKMSKTRLEDLIKVLQWEIEMMFFIIESYETRNDMQIFGGYHIEKVQKKIKHWPIPALELKIIKPSS